MSTGQLVGAGGSYIASLLGSWIYLLAGEPVSAHPVKARVHDISSEELGESPNLGASKRIRISRQDLPSGVSPQVEGRVLLSPPDPEWSSEELSFQGLEIVRVITPPGILVLEVAG